MKFLFVLFTLASLNLTAEGFGQSRITISRKNAPLKEIFKAIQKQSEYSFAYTDPLLSTAKPVNINVKNADLKQVLIICFNGQPLEYMIDDKIKIIIVKEKYTPESIPTPTIITNTGVLLSIKGKVVDEAGNPLARASVSVKGTSKATATDDKGDFLLEEVEDRAILVISSVGYETQRLPINGSRNITARMKMVVSSLDEAVVVAYNTTTQRSNTGSVTVVKGEQIQSLPNRSFDRSLQGMVPGLLVTPGNGQPGAGVSNFIVRGIGTAASTDNLSTARNPLIVIDGIPVSQDVSQIYSTGPLRPVSNPLAQLNPSDIESVSVLKDASAVSLYGAKASNGVILVTTKKGRSGKTVVSLRHQTDFASRQKGKIEVLNQQEYLELLYETYKNTDPTKWTAPAIRKDLFAKFPYQISASGDTSFYPVPDWYREVFANNAATISNEIGISGGGEKQNYYLNVEYTKQDGIVKETGFDRKSIRFNFENRPATWFKFGFNTTASYSIQNYAGPSRSGLSTTFANSVSPLNPVRLADGSYVLNYRWGTLSSPSRTANPVAAAEYNINRNTSFRGLSKLYAELRFKGVTLSSTVGVDYTQSEMKEKGDPRLQHPANSALPGTAAAGVIDELSVRRANLINTNLLRYNKVLNGVHAVNVVLGQEAQILTRKELGIGVTGLLLPYYEEINSPGVTEYRRDGFKRKETLLSYFGQANYGYKDRYFISASIRRDGSSRFGDDKKFGTYWSTGLAWEASKENFLKGANKWMDFLKFRGSIGAAGNAAAIDAFTRFDRIDYSRYMGGVAVYSTSTPGNPDIQWESTFTWDGGLEAAFLKERVRLSVDVYKRLTNNLVYPVTLPQSTGYFQVLNNIGKMENSGVEVSLGMDVIRSRQFRWSFSGNWSTNTNKLVKASIPLDLLNVGNIANEVGKPFNSFYLPKWAGVNAQTGLPQWIDSTGKISSDYFAAKREIVGKPQPDGFGALTNTFTFNDIELSAMLYYQYGFQIYGGEVTSLINDGAMPYANQSKAALNRWQKPGDIAENPRRMLNNTSDGGTNPSTRYLYDGDQLRLQNVTLGYRFPKQVISKLRLSSLKVYVQGNNLKVWTKYAGGDPANVNTLGTSSFAYPSARSYSVGLLANF